MTPTVETLSKTTLRLPAALLQAAKIRAVVDGEDLQDVVRKALEAYLKKKGGK